MDEVENITVNCEHLKRMQEPGRDEIHAKLRLAWLQAKASLDRSMKRNAEGLIDEILDLSLEHSLQEYLIATAVAEYK